MAQIFHPSTNTISKVSIFGGVFILALLGAVMAGVVRSPYVTEAGLAREQPIPFSHKHHVGDNGIDCRYCHTSVEEGPVAGIPAVSICMNCHSELWTESPLLEPLREAYRTGKPLKWTRVHDLSDYVYFDHSIHVKKGVGCDTCHGPVDRMPLMWRQESLLMEWCLECHRHPERYLRPPEAVFDMNWKTDNQEELGLRLMTQNNVRSKTSCSACHR